MNKIDMSIDIGVVRLKNPIIAASGTFGFGREYERFYDLNKLGGIAVKGLTLSPKKGNPPPRIAETPAGMLNSVGLQNPGVDEFIEKELPHLEKFDIIVIANISGNTPDEYCRIVQKLNNSSVDLIEINVSCPNVKQGGIAFGTDSGMIYDLTKKIKKVSEKPILVKLSPNVTDICEMASAAERAGADGISMINTLLGMAIDIERKKPVLGNTVGGLSGPAIKPVALRMIWQAYKQVNIPIIGMGGIMSGKDAIEFMMVGATGVSVGTANIVDPMACINIINEMEDYCKKKDIMQIGALTGCLDA